MLTKACLCLLLAAQTLAFDKNHVFGRRKHGLVPPPDMGNVDNKGVKAGSEFTFTQMLDHMNPSDSRTWTQYYWYNPVHYQPGGPIFLMLGGEGPGSSGWVTNENLYIMQMARMYNAAVFEIEHRYYGRSRPTTDLSVPNLKWLSSRQALADTANFIQAMNTQHQWANPKWITFGGSYSGALSAWMRQEYPMQVLGAIASSGPVFAEVDFKEYLEVVRDSLSSFSPMCTAAVKSGFDQIQTMITTPAGVQSLQRTFKFCAALDTTNRNDVINFYSNVIGLFQGIVQYSGDNVAYYANDVTIPNACAIMMDSTVSDYVTRIGNVANWFALKSNFGSMPQGCLMDNSYMNLVNFLKTEGYSDPNGDPSARNWVFQTCTEFGYFQSTDTTMAIFGNTVPVSFYNQLCTDVYGSAFTTSSVANGVSGTDNYYGGRDNYKGTNVVLPNGSIDPWHALGILSNKGPTTIAAFIQGTAHCADMYASRAADPPGLGVARNIIRDQIGAWLAQK